MTTNNKQYNFFAALTIFQCLKQKQDDFACSVQRVFIKSSYFPYSHRKEHTKSNDSYYSL